jgi:putative hydrolase of the HAD superfamily
MDGNWDCEGKKNCIDTVIFDLGAVLTDHRRPGDVINDLGLPYGDEQHEVWNRYKTGKITEDEFWDALTKGTHYEKDKEKVKLDVRNLFALAKPAEGYPFVARLKNAGYYVAILSNHSVEWGRYAVNTLGLDRICRPIIISAEVGMAKPDPAIYLHTLKACRRDHAPYGCLFIDDKQKNVDAAISVGMNAVRFVDGRTLENDLMRLGLL